MANDNPTVVTPIHYNDDIYEAVTLLWVARIAATDLERGESPDNLAGIQSLLGVVIKKLDRLGGKLPKAAPP